MLQQILIYTQSQTGGNQWTDSDDINIHYNFHYAIMLFEVSKNYRILI